MVADAILAERAAAMLTRRYPGSRPLELDLVIRELLVVAQVMRHKAETSEPVR